MRQALTIVVVSLLPVGCYDPDLSGPGGFSCAKTGECPAGFNCVNGVCLGPPDPAADVGQRLDVGNGDTNGDPDLGDARAPDGPLRDGPRNDRPIIPDLPKSDLPVVVPGTCTVAGKSQDISTVNAAENFSFAISPKGSAAVSFASEGSSPTLHLVTRSGASFMLKKLAPNAGDYSAVAFDTSDAPIVAYRELTSNSLKVWFDSSPHQVDGNNAGAHVAVGLHSSKDYRMVTYAAGGALKRALIRVNPSQKFSSQLYTVGTPTGVKDGTHLAQGILSVAGSPYTLAYVSTEPTPRVIHSVYFPLPSPSWKHYILDTISGLKIQDYGVGVAPVAGDGPPVVWASTGGSSGGFAVRYYLVGKTSTIASGTRPSYAVAPSSHEAVAYIKSGSIELISRKTAGQGSWTQPLVVHKAGFGFGVSKVIVQGTQSATPTTATWELVYRLAGNMSKLRRLHHIQVSCAY